jgi:hypothetical protein
MRIIEDGGVTRPLLDGGLAGAAATLAMSGVIWGLKHAGLYSSRTAPETVAEQTMDRLVPKESIPRGWRKALTGVEHLGFGSAGGVLYRLLAHVVPASLASGVLFGLALWFVSYKGWVPAADIMPPPEHDERGRAATMIAAHVVYGATLGLATRRAGQRRRFDDALWAGTA